jgi:hypothetical protein
MRTVCRAFAAAIAVVTALAASAQVPTVITFDEPDLLDLLTGGMSQVNTQRVQILSKSGSPSSRSYDSKSAVPCRQR